MEGSTDLGYKNSGLTGSLPSLEGDTLTPPLDHHNGTPTLDLYGLDHDSHASTTPDNNPGTIGYDYNNNELKTSGSQASNHTLNESDHNWHRSTNDDCLLTELDELIADSITAQSAMSLELDSLPENNVNKPSPKDVEGSTLATSDNHPKAPLQQEQENKQPDLDIGIGRVASTSESLSVVLASSTTEVLEKVESAILVSTASVPGVDSSISQNTNTNSNNSKSTVDEPSTHNDTNPMRNISSNDKSTKVVNELTSSLLNQDKQEKDTNPVVPSSAGTDMSPPSESTAVNTNVNASEANKDKHTSTPRKPMSESPASVLLNASGSVDPPSTSGRENSPSPDTSISGTPKEGASSVKIMDKFTVTDTTHNITLSAAEKDGIQSSKKDSDKEAATEIEDNAQISIKNATTVASESVVSSNTNTDTLQDSTSVSKSEASSAESGMPALIKPNENPAPIIDTLTIPPATISVGILLTTPESNTGINDSLNQQTSNNLNLVNNIPSQKEDNSDSQKKNTPGLSAESSASNDKTGADDASNHNKNLKRFQININEPHSSNQDESLALADIAAAAIQFTHSLTGIHNTNLTDSSAAETTASMASVNSCELGIFDIKKLIIQRLYGQIVESDSEIERVLSGTTDNDFNKHIVNTTSNHGIPGATNKSTHHSQKEYFRIPHLSIASGKNLWLTAEYQVLGQDHAGYMYVQRGKNDIYRFLWDLTGHKRDVWAPISARGWVRDEIALLKRVDAVLATPASISSVGAAIAGMKLIHNYPESGNNGENIEDVLFSDEYSSLSSLSTSDVSLDRLIDEFVGDHGGVDRHPGHNEPLFEPSNLSNDPEKDAEKDADGGDNANLIVYISTSDSNGEDDNRSMMLVDRVKRSKRKRRGLQSGSTQGTFDEDMDSDKRANHAQFDESESEYEGPDFHDWYNVNELDSGANNSLLNMPGRLRASRQSHDSYGEAINDDSGTESSDAPPAPKRPMLRSLKIKPFSKTTSSLTPPQSAIPRKSTADNEHVFTTRSGRQNRLPSRFLDGISEQEVNLLLPLKSRKKKTAKKVVKKNSKSSNATATVNNQKRTVTQQNGHARKDLLSISGDNSSIAMGANANQYEISSSSSLTQDDENSQASKASSIDSSSVPTSKPKQKPKRKSRTQTSPDTSSAASPGLPSSPLPVTTIPENEVGQEKQNNKGPATTALVSPPPGPVISARARRQQLRAGPVIEDSLVVVDISSDED